MITPLCLTIYGVMIAMSVGLEVFLRRYTNSPFHFTRRWKYISTVVLVSILIWISPVTLVKDMVFCLGFGGPSVSIRGLEQLLEEKQWEEADKETSWLLRLASETELKIEPTLNTVDHLPCADLQAMDRLWIQYSQGRFGFSVQRQIYDHVVHDGGFKKTLDIINRVDELTKSNKKQFNLNAPVGHLPSSGLWLSTLYINHSQSSVTKLAERQSWCGL
jgi:hypothetical protein